MENRIIKNSKVLVTGGAGFIGSNLVEALLAQNNYVVCLDNLSTGKIENIERFLTSKNFKFIQKDICNLDDCRNSVEGIEYVLHQAALGSVPRSIENPVLTNNVNVCGFVNMLTAAKDAGVKRFVYASSSSVYGDSTELPKVEEKIGRPLSPYAVTKYANEVYAKVFSDIYGIETIGLRYFNVFGRRQDPDGPYAAVVPKFTQLLLKHKNPVIYGDGKQFRDFTYIDNVVQANQLAALVQKKEALNTVYNVAFGESVTLNDLTEILIFSLGKYDNKIASIKPVYGPERKGDIKCSLASIEKAARLLEYKPEFSLNKGLAVSMDWYYNILKT